jgi:ABC-type microcin C transport system duplicated ATPase subunit YejF
VTDTLNVRIKLRLTGDGGRRPVRDDADAPFALDLDFATRPGINIIFGPSGAGKTSTLRAIAGLIAPDEGRIAHGARVLFDSTARINLAIQARRVGFVFQDATLFPHLTAAQNVAYGLHRADAPTKATRVAELLALFHVAHVARRYPQELSGGESQRVALMYCCSTNRSPPLTRLRAHSCSTRSMRPSVPPASPSSTSHTTTPKPCVSARICSSCTQGASSSRVARSTCSMRRRA